MANSTGIQRAVESFDGSPSKLAKAVGGGVLRQHVEHWLKTGRVSAERCPEVAAATGIRCEDLNDQVNWALVRSSEPTKTEAAHG
ncbi:YdaS family helix-turn-helix protein [Acidovorax sp. A1169]|uniref:YdaS family helix-turn-helix protein n=1 Tax=Acidovorax sp. A1169 TaxID=3059524 RepID=UPI002737F548|nr:YdaS family helix-turn-helix protein [Acidovorax sp. A1169]MDP4076218.1 YdaS family helix-turn-helix protein [Acidovorax sp. A1169]